MGHNREISRPCFALLWYKYIRGAEDEKPQIPQDGFHSADRPSHQARDFRRLWMGLEIYFK
jgi:hypothetical protein